jgi:hypothetical protein
VSAFSKHAGVVLARIIVAAGRLLAGCGLDVVGAFDPAQDVSAAGGASSGAPGVLDGGRGVVDGGGAPETGGAVLDGGATKDAATGPAVSIAVKKLDTAPQTINLTAEGTLDWVYWGYDGNMDSSVRKANVAPLIASAYDRTGSFTRGTEIINDAYWPITQTWTDGTAPTRGSSKAYTYLIGTENVTITMEADASTTPRTFVFWTAAKDVNAQIEATLTDKSTASESVQGSPTRYRVEITYAAKAAKDTLQVRWRVTQKLTTASDAGILITSAALK